MGAYASCFKHLFGGPNVKIAITGLSDAGKTTFLYKLKLGEVVTSDNLETVEYKNLTFCAFDIDKSDKNFTEACLKSTNGIIFFVDSNDPSRFSEANMALQQIAQLTPSTPVLILANKQDTPQAVNCGSVVEKVGIDSTLANRNWFIQAACSTSGEGLYEGVNWLTHNLRF